jgi:diguanylate cyclase (GGDEF)-like protein
LCQRAINDTQGHALGDRVLCTLAEVIRVELRKDDVLGRLGGDEFVFILPGIDLASATCVAERLRACAAESLREIDGVALAATISIGLATLYRAKADGRDRVGDSMLAVQMPYSRELKPSA